MNQWAAKFWAKVQKGDGCWIWQGSCLPVRNGQKGYGRFYPAWKQGFYAHRFAWQITNGREIPAGMEICHTCDVPSCVRPDHLFLGSRSDNMRDCVAKGRARLVVRKGTDHHDAKLTEEDVRSIRQRYAAGGVTQRQLAEEFKVTRGLIGQIVRRVAWRHITEAGPSGTLGATGTDGSSPSA